ncbi:hypothetical protein H310_01587 [Aphanomyces invadans]|uniref:Uncharacterized protein n=1 Tax=Aphanomyces invadans TaxID=157072 RepID=A0A024UU05_9STRA|nr:hypothetical protein H310_01587 [Aphanomyces invadans]ETW09153.1 hypothetical protein H310_01587 [Aphanomyces invadans]|eukprot:XP_008862958.1 hypothetical protein H310_01587 [Aphanomyces invadans]
MDRYSDSETGANREKGGKKSWTAHEDQQIVKLVGQLGCKNWSKLAKILNEECGSRNGVERSGKQCRERWHNHLDASITKGPWTKEEEVLLVAAHAEHGNQWSKIAKLFHGRTDNAIKNRWFAKQRRESRRSVKAQMTRTTTPPSAFSDSDEAQLTPRHTTHDRVRALCSEYGGISPKPQSWMQHPLSKHDIDHCLTSAAWNQEVPYLSASLSLSQHHATPWRALHHTLDEMGTFDLSMMPDDDVENAMDASAYSFSMPHICATRPTSPARDVHQRRDVAPPLPGSGFPLVEIDLDWTDKVLI